VAVGFAHNILIFLVLSACDETDDRTCTAQAGVVVAPPEGWAITPADTDPFEDRPAEVRCLEWGVRLEGASLEVNTGECAYATLVQVVPEALPVGSVLTATVAHFDLVAPERATAHVAIGLGDVVLWSRDLPVPSAAGVYPIEVPLTEPVPAGTRVYFHVHNHGSNSWFLTTIDARFPPCP